MSFSEIKINLHYGGLMKYENKRDSDNGDKAVDNEKGEVQREEGHDAGKEKGCVCEREEAHGAESESESNGVGDGERTEVEEDVVEEVLAEGDTRFTSFFEEIRNQEATGLGDLHDNIREAADEGRDTHHDEAELEMQCRDIKHPTSAENNDDEWEDFNRKEREVSRTRYNNEKPPYFWLLQKFNSGEEFKEQILRYVLKGMDATFPLTLDLELQICSKGYGS